jgi:hypothetical protein
MTDTVGVVEVDSEREVVVRHREGSTRRVERRDVVVIKEVPPPPPARRPRSTT